MVDFTAADTAAMQLGMMPNWYYNQVALNDLSDMNLTLPVVNSIDPMLSMNNSIFNGMGYNMGYNMGFPQFMPTFTANNPQNYWENLEQYDNFMIDRQIRRQERMREADLRLNAPQEGIQRQAELLHDKILRDEQEQIQTAYRQFIDSVKQMYPNATPEQIESKAELFYRQINQTGVFEDIRKNGKGSFEQGFLQSLTFGLADGKTAEENVSDLTGLPVGRTENVKRIAGKVVGGAAAGGVVTLATIPLLKALKVGAKSKTFWGILAGTAAAVISMVNSR